jgi:hypothetical protein
MRKKLKMKKEDLDFSKGEYREKCSCGKELSLWSQKESHYCEYEHDVWLECPECKELVQFVISVN